ncbi:MAG TPA: DUF192 domain-containing protein [Actinomycetota bacterium]
MNRSRRLPVLAAFVFTAALTSSCNLFGGESRSAAGLPTGTLRISGSGGQTIIQVEIAESERERRTGLMFRRHLAPDAGMAFLFERPTRTAFWMMHTFIPLSIAFWDGSNRIVAMYDMDPCTRVRCPVYAAQTPIVGAVEANRGFFKAHGIRVGATIELDR